MRSDAKRKAESGSRSGWPGLMRYTAAVRITGVFKPMFAVVMTAAVGCGSDDRGSDEASGDSVSESEATLGNDMGEASASDGPTDTGNSGECLF